MAALKEWRRVGAFGPYHVLIGGNSSISMLPDTSFRAAYMPTTATKKWFYQDGKPFFLLLLFRHACCCVPSLRSMAAQGRLGAPRPPAIRDRRRDRAERSPRGARGPRAAISRRFCRGPPPSLRQLLAEAVRRGGHRGGS